MDSPRPPIHEWTILLARIEREQLEPLLSFRHIISQMHKVLDKFKGVVPPAHEIAEHFRQGYSAFACARLRNFDEKQHPNPKMRVVSLRALLDEVRPYCTRMTRRWFTEQYRPEHRKFANRDFDRVTGTPGCDHMPEAVIDQDIKALEDTVKPYRHVTNKYLAHTSEVRPEVEQFPTFGEMSAAIDGVTAAFRRYRLLVTNKDSDIIPLDELDVTDDFERLFRRE